MRGREGVDYNFWDIIQRNQVNWYSFDIDDTDDIGGTDDIDGTVDIDGTYDIDGTVDIDGTYDIDGTVGIDGTVDIDGTDDIDYTGKNDGAVNDWIWSSSLDDIDPYWKSSTCTPYFGPTCECD